MVLIASKGEAVIQSIIDNYTSDVASHGRRYYIHLPGFDKKNQYDISTQCRSHTHQTESQKLCFYNQFDATPTYRPSINWRIPISNETGCHPGGITLSLNVMFLWLPN